MPAQAAEPSINSGRNPVLPLVTDREVDVDTSYNQKYSDHAAIVCETAPIFTPFGRELLRL
jgi:hypothetical protein